MRVTLTDAIEDYLKSIYKLTLKERRASTKDIAIQMGVKPASVTGMLQRLASTTPPLILYHKHRGVELTEDGRKAALKVIRHHRLIEAYLVENLGYTWDEVHEEAERLEHVISEEFEARIASALGHPERDPHGEPIPTADLNVPPDNSVPLSSLRPNDRGLIQHVHADDSGLLRHLEDLGLVPGVEVDIKDYSVYDHNIHVVVADQNNPLVLGLPISSCIFVEII